MDARRGSGPAQTTPPRITGRPWHRATPCRCPARIVSWRRSRLLGRSTPSAHALPRHARVAHARGLRSRGPGRRRLQQDCPAGMACEAGREGPSGGSKRKHWAEATCCRADRVAKSRDHVLLLGKARKAQASHIWTRIRVAATRSYASRPNLRALISCSFGARRTGNSARPKYPMGPSRSSGPSDCIVTRRPTRLECARPARPGPAALRIGA